MILANGCKITKSEKFKGVWILSVPIVYDILLSDEWNWSCPGSSKLYNGSEWP